MPNDILEILEANDGLCMDDEEDRQKLARELRAGLARLLTNEANQVGDNGYGMQLAIQFVQDMKL